MKKIRFLAILATLMLLLTMLPAQVLATEQDGSRKVNVAFVIDGSGSLINGHKADVEGNRYEAVDYFLDVMAESGNNAVTAIVFNANTTSSTDAESMMSGLALNTGLVTISDEGDKEDLKEKIRNAHVGGYTDIGTALLTAAQTLEKQSAQNGLESAIILFTDGSTELPSNAAYQQSIANRDAAVNLIKDRGIDLFGLFLNHKNTSSSTEVLDMVRKAHGYPSTATAEDLSHRYFAVTSSEDLQAAFDNFYAYIFGTGSDNFDVNKDKTFLVPGIGVEDVNISIMAPSSVLSQISVTLTRPNGTVYTADELESILSRGKTYALYKISNPDAGLWTVRVNAPSDNVTIDCKLIINLSIGAQLDAPQTIPGKTPFTVGGYLTYKGQTVTDPASYREYECVLRVVSATGQETLYPMTLSDEGKFVTDVTLPEFTTYYANVTFTCGESISISSDSVTWAPVNTNPAAPANYVLKSSVGLFGGKKPGRIDLADLVTDAEDSDELLSYTLSTDSYNAEAVTLEGTNLTVDGELGGSGTFTVTFADTDGGKATTNIQVKFANTVVLEIVLLIVGLILVVAGILVWLYYHKTGLQLDGRVTLTFTLLHESNEHEISLTLDGCMVSNRTLYEVLTDSRDDLRRTIQGNYRLRPYADKLTTEFISGNETELRRVRFGTVKGEKRNKSDATAPVYLKLIVAAAPAKSQTTGQARKASAEVLSGGKAGNFPMSIGPSGRVRHYLPNQGGNDTFTW